MANGAINLAWLAGFFEADGCIMTHGANKGNPQPTVSFTQKDPHNLRVIQTAIGGRLKQDGRGYWRLRITDTAGTRKFCWLVFPHLINPRTKEQVKFAYQLGGLVGKTGQTLTKANRRRRMELHEKIKGLKRL